MQNPAKKEQIKIHHIDYGLINVRKNPTLIFVLVDDKRQILFTRAYKKESISNCLSFLKQAWKIHGKADFLFCDKGPIFTHKDFIAALKNQGIKIVHLDNDNYRARKAELALRRIDYRLSGIEDLKVLNSELKKIIDP